MCAIFYHLLLHFCMYFSLQSLGLAFRSVLEKLTSIAQIMLSRVLLAMPFTFVDVRCVLCHVIFIVKYTLGLNTSSFHEFCSKTTMIKSSSPFGKESTY
jgi:hypothetical protein